MFLRLSALSAIPIFTVSFFPSFLLLQLNQNCKAKAEKTGWLLLLLLFLSIAISKLRAALN